MKIAISSTGKTIEDEIDPKFGRCSYFLIVEIKDNKIKDFKAIENTAQAQMGGAGITAAEIVGNEKSDVVITVNTGPRAFQVLNQLKIKVYKAEGKIKKAVEEFMNDQLEEITNATGPQHMGLK